MQFILGLLLTLLFAGSALADSTVYVIARTQAEADGINTQIAAERAKAARARATLNTLSNQFNAIKARHDPLQRQYAIDAAAYNSNCAGRPVSTPGCPAWRARVASEQQQLTPLLHTMEVQAAGLQRQGQQLSNEAVLADARAQKLTNYRSQILANVQNLKASLAQQCAGITASSNITEMNQKCGTLQYAGTAPPSCTTSQCSGFKLAAPPPEAAQPVANTAASTTANTPACEGTFCTKDNPKNAGGVPVAAGQPQTKYDSASAQADAAKKMGQDGGCVFDGQPGCAKGTSLSFPQGGGRGSAGLSDAVRQAMSKTPEGQKLFGEEAALRGQLASAESKVAEIKAKRDATTDDATRGQLAVDMANADQIKTNIGQQLYVKEIAVETEAKKFVLDK